MSDTDKKKFVRFDLYCRSCVHCNKTAAEPPCDDCLEIPAREFSHKPEHYVKDDKIKEIFKDEKKK